MYRSMSFCDAVPNWDPCSIEEEDVAAPPVDGMSNDMSKGETASLSPSSPLRLWTVLEETDTPSSRSGISRFLSANLRATGCRCNVDECMFWCVIVIVR